jgi:TetR/AcrR family transcriptional regulator, lmrAB and yxaGH operons repressor
MRKLGIASRREDLPTKPRIIRAGVMLFQAHGYHGTGIAMIIEHAGIPKGSFYHHFPGGKEQLAVATLEWLQSEVQDFLDKLARRGASFRTMVLGIAHFTAAGLRESRTRRGSLLAVLAQDAIPESAAIMAAARQFADGIRMPLLAALERENIATTHFGLVEQALALLQGSSVMARIEGNANRAIEIVESWLDVVLPPRKKQ